MWDLETALQASAVVVVAALLAPPLARRIGGICAVIGFFGVMQSSTWAPTVAALGLLAWFVGHWTFAVRNDALPVEAGPGGDRQDPASLDNSEVLAAAPGATSRHRPLTLLVSG